MSQNERPMRLPFLIALFGAPALFGLIVWSFGLMGDYAMRFAQVGAIGMLLMLPAWFTAFAWLAWRARKRGERGIRTYVFASLGANIATGVIYPLMVGVTVITGVYEKAVAASASTDNPFEAPAPLDAALWLGVGTFFFGLFFLPILAALFGWLIGKLDAMRED